MSCSRAWPGGGRLRTKDLLISMPTVYRLQTTLSLKTDGADYVEIDQILLNIVGITSVEDFVNLFSTVFNFEQILHGVEIKFINRWISFIQFAFSLSHIQLS